MKIIRKKDFKIKWLIPFAISAVFLVVIIFSYFSFFQGGKDSNITQAPTKEELIKSKIGEFSIKEELEYQGGTIIKAVRNEGEMALNYTLFYKDGQLQRLPDDYVIDVINLNLSENEKKNKTVSFKFQEEFKTGVQDPEGKYVVYNNIFIMTKELPESEWNKNSMDVETNKYQNILVDEYGQFLFKFLSSQII